MTTSDGTSGFLDRIEDMLIGVSRWLGDRSGDHQRVEQPGQTKATKHPTVDDPAAQVGKDEANPIKHWRWS